MTNDIDISLIGDKELLATLRELDEKTQLRYLKRVVSDAANILVKAEKRVIKARTTKLIPPVSGDPRRWHTPGTAKRSITKKMGRSRRNATVFVGPRAGKEGGWYLRFQESGTIKERRQGLLKGAFDANKKLIEDNMSASIRKIFTRVIAKHKR